MLQGCLMYQVSSEGNGLGIYQHEDSFLENITASIELVKQKQPSCIHKTLGLTINILGNWQQPKRTPLPDYHKDSLYTLGKGNELGMSCMHSGT